VAANLMLDDSSHHGFKSLFAAAGTRTPHGNPTDALDNPGNEIPVLVSRVI
jgi:hypothetical protein